MKSLIVLAAAISAILAVPESPLYHEWNEFKLTHNKQYGDLLEEVRRMDIFIDNVAKIEEHNVRYEKGEVNFTKGMNQFGDWTSEEFLEYVNRGKASRPQKNETYRLDWEEPQAAAASGVDWRGTAVTEVKNQGSCGSCWSFSTTGAVEGQLALRGGRLVSLSEQNLIDCTTGYGNMACDGGWMDNAFSFIHDYGIMQEYSYPYEGRLNYCRFDSRQSVTSLRGYYDLPSGSEQSLQNAVANNGPVSVAIDATDELQFYNGGIFYDQWCNGRNLNHAVLVVGYGSQNGYDYWIVKNSWGRGWGDGGYYYAIRNYGNNCGISNTASYPAL